MFIYDKQCEKRKTSAVSLCALVQSGAPCWKKSRGNRAREINPCKALFLNLSNSLRKLAFMTAALMIQLIPLPNIKTHSQVDKDTTKLAYMRAAMTSLAYVHGITFSFMKVASFKILIFHLSFSEMWFLYFIWNTNFCRVSWRDHFPESWRQGAAPGWVSNDKGAGGLIFYFSSCR